ncbi:polysaccharide deacetylase family protein [Geomonas terrae]|uniref:Polysaccharide deacetylase family protein n=1 Tax=Geomonas terrae TaxID=2562681 RepID=A0A4S1CFL7_9BACT|nr:polysaccharide deacetylase family protein [Geomonas terrae]TGU72338.1 polysaccharide deacetylase family protein [Geomonas terrae]
MTAEKEISVLLSDALNLVNIPLAPAATMLVYHRIEGGSAPLQPDSVTLTEFQEQMRYITEEGYAPMTARELAALVEAGEEPPEKSVVVTFDDGYLDTYTHAFPELDFFRMPATVFLAAGHIGASTPFPWLGSDGGKPMDWQQVSKLQKAGIEIASHTYSHPFTPNLTKNELCLELERSKGTIEDKLGAPVHSLALPYSFPMRHPRWPSFRARLREALNANDYVCCCTMQRGHIRPRDDVFALRRIPVGRDDDLRLFRAKLEGCFAWTAPLQAFYQRFLKSYPTP